VIRTEKIAIAAGALVVTIVALAASAVFDRPTTGFPQGRSKPAAWVRKSR